MHACMCHDHSRPPSAGLCSMHGRSGTCCPHPSKVNFGGMEQGGDVCRMPLQSSKGWPGT